MLGSIILIMIFGFITGSLARLAVPGPDPMPIWLTVAIGLAGSAGGGAVALAIWGRGTQAVGLFSFLGAFKQLDFTQNEGTNFRITARQEKSKRGQECAASNADEAIEQRIHTPFMSSVVACCAVALCEDRKTSLAFSSIIEIPRLRSE